MSIFNITSEIIVGFFLLFFIVKFVGRKIIKQISPFTFIAAIVLGELLGNGLYQDDVGLFYIVYTMALWSILLFTVEFLGQKFLAVRGFFEGKPSALIKNGVIDREELKKNRMNINQLQAYLGKVKHFQYEKWPIAI